MSDARKSLFRYSDNHPIFLADRKVIRKGDVLLSLGGDSYGVLSGLAKNVFNVRIGGHNVERMIYDSVRCVYVSPNGESSVIGE